MKIYIQGIQELYQRTVDVLLQLFFEDSTNIYEDLHNGQEQGGNTRIRDEDKQENLQGEPDKDIHLYFEFNEAWDKERENLSLEGNVTVKNTNNPRIVKGSYSQDFAFSDVLEEEREKAFQKAYKRVINHTLLQALEEYTGTKQPWGILTGIRPTKLLHQKLFRGTERDQARQELIHDYQIVSEKVQLMQQIIDRQLAVVPDLHHLENEISIYIGIPFCPTKCAYCTFPAYDIKGQQGSVGTFLEGLHLEIQEMGNWLKENNIGITTIYFGGGTPTSIEAEQMDALYEQMYRYFPAMEKVREVTVEAGRPDTITPDKINVLRKHNIDRISINPQSYTQETLDAIGRHHTVKETIEKYELARSMGLSNINMDLIIGLPGEGLAELELSLEKTRELRPESLTVHTLSFKRASTMTKNKEKYKVAGREEVIQMMKMASKWTAAEGYEPYYLYRQKNILGNLENVGYALPGKESIYNIMIMEEKQTILGLGCGASSKFIHPLTGKITRFANPKEPRAYNQSYKHYIEEKRKLLNELYLGVTNK
ncbi:coproporphyrinogen III oxidase [Bacillus horti]|uniref:Oxygen-independent coproporphyrinogen-3 oxidase n=1 Tax=Caldalkalibacillus horti TaxID=77523 RepID=A0ABT9W667_9BACI|nr:coproporphyrinogen III oxidase [Bacillus horti]MDQ0168345.1 oxygen-independent coproporphyrinogen-3 oxidase [Bacillus horti]